MFSESIVTIVETIQCFPKDKTCIGFSRVKTNIPASVSVLEKMYPKRTKYDGYPLQQPKRTCLCESTWDIQHERSCNVCQYFYLFPVEALPRVKFPPRHPRFHGYGWDCWSLQWVPLHDGPQQQTRLCRIQGEPMRHIDNM